MRIHDATGCETGLQSLTGTMARWKPSTCFQHDTHTMHCSFSAQPLSVTFCHLLCHLASLPSVAPAAPDLTFVPVPAHTGFAAYWQMIPERTSPHPQPIDVMINAGWLVRGPFTVAALGGLRKAVLCLPPSPWLHVTLCSCSTHNAVCIVAVVEADGAACCVTFIAGHMLWPWYVQRTHALHMQ